MGSRWGLAQCEGRGSAAIVAPRQKGSWKEAGAWHHVAGSDSKRPRLGWPLTCQSLVKKMIDSCAYWPICWRTSPIQVLSFQMTLGCVRLTEKPMGKIEKCFSSIRLVSTAKSWQLLWGGLFGVKNNTKFLTLWFSKYDIMQKLKYLPETQFPPLHKRKPLTKNCS